MCTYKKLPPCHWTTASNLFPYTNSPSPSPAPLIFPLYNSPPSPPRPHHSFRPIFFIYNARERGGEVVVGGKGLVGEDWRWVKAVSKKRGDRMNAICQKQPQYRYQVFPVYAPLYEGCYWPNDQISTYLWPTRTRRNQSLVFKWITMIAVYSFSLVAE